MSQGVLEQKTYWGRLRKGRRLTFLVTLLAVFVALALIAHSIRLLHLDVAMTRALQQNRFPWLDVLMIMITLCGNTLTLLAFGIGIAFALHRAGYTRAAWFNLFALLGLPLNWLLKQLVDRPRPAVKDMVQVILSATGYSFPSGHAMASVMFYGFLIFLLRTEFAQTRRYQWAANGLIVLVACIGLSRVYLGDHWISDVLAGWAAGAFCLMLLIQGYRLMAENLKAPSEGIQTDSPSQPPVIE